MDLPGVEVVRLELEFRVRILVKPSSEQRQQDLNPLLDQRLKRTVVSLRLENLPAALDLMSVVLATR